MEAFTTPVSQLIPRRFSCRIYSGAPLDEGRRRQLQAAIAAPHPTPFGSTLRFSLVAASEEDRSSLRGLGAYGSIKGASGFIVGAVLPGERNLEDFGYALERLVLRATDLGLGTCWLGGFTKNTFHRAIAAGPGEQVPGVAAIGVMDEERLAKSAALRQRVSSDKRLPWEQLFFGQRFGLPLPQDQAGQYALPLELVRLGPSASNKQPWRIIRDGQTFHFFLQRTPGYATRWVARLVGVADLQRLDLGIAMYHFEAAATELGLPGTWVLNDPGLAKPDELTEYVASWVAH